MGAIEDFPQDGDRPLDERRADFPQHRLGDVHRLAALPLVLAIDIACVESVGLLRGDHALDLFEQALCVALRSIGRKAEARFDPLQQLHHIIHQGIVDIGPTQMCIPRCVQNSKVLMGIT